MFSVFNMTHEIVIINYLYHQRLEDPFKGVAVMKRFGKILENLCLSPSLPPLSRSLSRLLFHNNTLTQSKNDIPASIFYLSTEQNKKYILDSKKASNDSNICISASMKSLRRMDM